MRAILRRIKIIVKMVDGLIFAKVNSMLNPNFECTPESKRCFNNRKSPNFRYEYFGKDTPVCCATHLYTILKDVTEVLEENNLEYFISFGTLLGAIRHGGMIPWDTDTDILIPESQKEKIFEVLQQNLAAKYVVKNDIDDSIVGSLIRVNLSSTNTLHIDLFTYIDRGDSIIFGYQREFKKESIYPLQKVKYYDLKLFAPKDLQHHLELIYGKDYMKYAYRQWAFNKNRFKLNDFRAAKIKKGIS